MVDNCGVRKSHREIGALPWPNFDGSSESVGARQKLISDGTKIVAVPWVSIDLGVWPMHPSQADAKFVNGRLQLTTGVLVVFRKLLIPTTVL